MSAQGEPVYQVLVQLASFLSEVRAQQFQKSLTAQGRKSYIRAVVLSNQTFFRVIERIGSYSDESNANRQVEALKRKGIKAFIEKTNTNQQVSRLLGKTIVLDPGHDGSSPGATGPMGTKEYEITLQVAKLAKEKLIQEGAKVQLTRESAVAVSLYLRPQLANNLQANLFVSLHMDAFTDRIAHGTTVLYRETPAGSLQLAKAMENSFQQYVGLRNRGVKLDTRGLAVLRRAKVPAVLVEMGFISNPQEEALFRGEATQLKAAQAILEGCLDFILGVR